MDKISVLAGYPAMRWLSVSVVVGCIAVVAGCAAPETRSSRQVAGTAEQIPVPAELTLDQERERSDAKQAYVSCPKQAAQFMKALLSKWMSGMSTSILQEGLPLQKQQSPTTRVPGKK